MANIVNLMNHIVNKESQIATNKDDISDLKSNLNKTDFTVKVLQNDFETKGRSFERGLLFYGYPTDIDNLYEVDLCIPRYSQFDVVVLADGVQKQQHEDHTNCVQIISKVRLVHNTKFFGYVPIGCLTSEEDEETEGSNRTMDQLKQDVLDWIDTGVQGIFLDEFGYDYKVTRDRQNEIVKFCHDHDLVVIANSWDCDYCFSDDDIVLDFDPVNGHHGNPNKLHSELSAADYILFEHIMFNATSTTKEVASEPWDVYRIQQYYEDYYQTFKTKVFIVNSLPSKASQEIRNHIVRTTTLAGVVMQADCVGVSTEFWNSENNTSYMCKDLVLDRSNARFINVKMAKKGGKEIPVKYTTKVGDDEYSLIWNATKETDKTFSVDKFYCTVNGLTDTELYPTYDKLDAKIKELKTQLESLSGITEADLNGDYTITSGGTYILSLLGNSSITVNLPENSSAKVILKQTGSFSCTLPDCFKDPVQIGSAEGIIDVLEFTNYGKLRGNHIDQY